MNKTCCFFGHRKIENTIELREKLYNIIENLIVSNNIENFLFGSKSEFNTLCHKTVNRLKEKYPHIKRIYVRAEYPCIDDNYKSYLLENYECTYYPESIISSAKAVYVERNYYMIDKSDACVVYFNPNYKPPRKQIKHYGLTEHKTKSGTKIAYEYARKNGKMIINILDVI